MVDTNSYYGDFITNFDEICRKSIVHITSYNASDPSKKLLRSGVIIAATDRSCLIITSSGIYERNEVEFYDGTKKQCVSKFVSISNDFNLAAIPIFDHGNEHWQTANFSDNEVKTNQKVFTCGFNLDTRRNFISGGLVSAVNVINGFSHKKGTVFVHSCSTSSAGSAGSAVFNETKELVGINFFYTECRGVDYVSTKPSLCGTSTSASTSASSSSGGIIFKSNSDPTEYGGLVSALDLSTIKSGLEDMYPDTKRMSLQGTLQYLRNNLASRDSKMVV